MKRVAPILCTVLLLSLAAFCVFGFLATFEPTDHAVAFRIGYALIGLSCLTGSALQIATALRR